MTYVPPEEKRGGSSGFGDFVYIIMFYLFEGLFIFVGIPFIVLAIAFLPLSMFYIVTGTFDKWPLYVFGGIVAFIQILALQFFLKRYVLEPHGKTFGQWLKWKFSPKEIRRRRAEKRKETRRMVEWYSSMERVKLQKEKIIQEQTYDLRDEWFSESGDPDQIAPKKEQGIVFGEISEQVEPIREEKSMGSSSSFTIEAITTETMDANEELAIPREDSPDEKLLDKESEEEEL